MLDKKHLLEKLTNDTAVNEKKITSKIILFVSLLLLFWVIYFLFFDMSFGFDNNKKPNADDVSSSGDITMKDDFDNKNGSYKQDSLSNENNFSQSESIATNHSLSITNSRANSSPVIGDRESPSVVLNASGYVVARRAATVSAELSGLLRQVLVEEGDSVSKGQVLAVLDRALAGAELDVVNHNIEVKRVSIAALEADINESQRESTRLQALRASNFVSEELFTQAQTRLFKHENALLVVKAEIAQLTAQKQLKQLEYDKHSIRAPFDGVVIEKNAQMGEIVSPDSAGGGFTRTGICTLVDMSSLEIEVEVNEAYIQKVFSGQQVNAILDAYKGENITSYVEAIIPAADRAKGVFRVRIKINELNEKILPGMGVTVSFLN